MFRSLLQTAIYAVARAALARRPKPDTMTIDLPEARPDMSREDIAAFVETVAKIRQAPERRDEDRNPPPPWLAPMGAK